MNLDEKIEYLRNKGLQKRAKHRWYKKWWGILLLIIISIIITYSLSFLFLIFHFVKNPDKINSLFNSQELQSPDINSGVNSQNIKIIEGNNNYFLGSATPKFTIVVFSDFTCPYCQQSSQIIANLAIKYGNDVKIIIRDYPIISDESLDLAISARCAGEQGKYWPMYYKMFEMQGQFLVSGINSIAQLVGVNDIDKFSNCVLEQKYLNDVLKDASDAEFLKTTGTPAWFVNGVKVSEGVVPFETWTKFLDEALKEK